MKKDKHIQKELQALAPALSKMKKDNPFKVPIDYFIELPQEIRKQTIEQKNPISFLDLMLQLLKQHKYAVSLSMISILVLLGLFMFKQQDSSFKQLSLDKISQQEINQFIAYNIDEFDEDMILQTALVDEETDIYDLQSHDELDEYIEEYLINEIDEETLEEILL